MGRELAFPVRTDPFGPAPHASVVLTRPSNEVQAWFKGTLDAGDGRCLDVPGPDEPARFFLFDVKAVLFWRHAGAGLRGIAILYDSSQIGPMHGTDRRALALRIETGSLVRQPGLERRLERLSRPGDRIDTWTRKAVAVLR